VARQLDDAARGAVQLIEAVGHGPRAALLVRGEPLVHRISIATPRGWTKVS
jgi:hypothetical protein